jgi:hypothetical protein
MPASPTGHLRFILRSSMESGKTVSVLQQEWRLPYTTRDTHGEMQLEYDYEWRDVPLYIPKEGER